MSIRYTMKDIFVVEQKPFLSILASIQPICSKRTTLEATSLILFQLGHKELVIKSTDLEISFQASYILKECSINAPRTFLVSGKRIFDLIKELENDISCTITDNSLLLNSGKAHLSLHIQEAQAFPPFPERIENLMQFDTQFLLNMISKVAFLIPQNNANNALNGLFLEISNAGCTMTATDGHCLAQIISNQYTLPEEKKWLLPRRAIFELKKIIESARDTHIFLGMCSNQLVFSGESFNFFTKLLADQFPQYAPILDKKDFIPATIDRSHFMKTLRRSSCLLSGKFISTRFDFKNDVMKVSIHNKEVGSLEEEIILKEVIDIDIDIRFYAPYLLNGLQAFEQNNLLFYLKSSAQPIIFQAQEDQFHLMYLVMPIAPTHG